MRLRQHAGPSGNNDYLRDPGSVHDLHYTGHHNNNYGADALNISAKVSLETGLFICCRNLDGWYSQIMNGCSRLGFTCHCDP
jgi:hypothetical protein